MADEMLARLDQLQRGAREPPSRRQEHNAHSVYGRYDTYENEPEYYDEDVMYEDENIYPSELHGTQLFIALMMRLTTDWSCRRWPNRVPRTIQRASFAPLANASTSAGRKEPACASTDGPA